MIWLLRWIGLNCPFSNTTQCKKRFDTILSIKNEDPRAFNNLFYTSEDILPAIRSSSVFGDNQMITLSRRTPGVLNVVTYIQGKRNNEDRISINEISVDQME